MQTSLEEEFDYVVVGAGAAGCLLAERLSRSGEHSVLVLNSGSSDISFWSHLPLGYGALIRNPRYDWVMPSEPSPQFNGRVFHHSVGRDIGGSGSINGLIFLRGDRADFDSWKEAGNEGWGWEDVLPAFQAIETYRGAQPSEERGQNGPIVIQDQPDQYPLDHAFIEAARQVGVPFNPDFNRGDLSGAGYYQINTAKARRCSTAIAYLRPALKRPNLTVRSRAHATRILTKDKEATGVEYDFEGVRRTAKARREVVLAAGAYHTPQLLQLSGIGPRAELDRHGIATVHALEGVGENFQNHYNLTVAYKSLAAGSLNERMGSTVGKIGMGLQYVLSGRGPLATNATHVGVHLRSSQEKKWPDIKLTLSLFSRKGVNLKDARKDLHKFPGFSVHVHLMRPDFRGRVGLRGSDPTLLPRIELSCSDSPVTARQISHGVTLLRKMVATPAFSAYAPEELMPTRDCKTDAELHELFRKTGENSSHPIGTCKMGPAHDDKAVVDARLRVHGMSRLRIVDASVMPTQIAANTHATTIMIAERGARFILGEEAA